jgi:hypothetical protein
MKSATTLIDEFYITDISDAYRHAYDIYRSDYKNSGALLKTLMNGILSDRSGVFGDKINFLQKMEQMEIIKVDDFVLDDDFEFLTIRCKGCGKLLKQSESMIGLLCWNCGSGEKDG